MASLPVPPSKANENPSPLNPNAESFTPTMATPKISEPSFLQNPLGLPHLIFHGPLFHHAAAGKAFYDMFSQPQPAGGYSGAYGAVNSRDVVDHKVPSLENSPRKRGNKDKKLAWVAKKPAALSYKEDQSGHHQYQETHLGGNTTIMIRNIPNQFERNDLLRILDGHCREENIKAQRRSDPCTSEYDFLYLPMDFMRGANLGYAFVNFTSAVAAVRFYKVFHKFQWKVAANKKICEINRAKFQGKEALKRRFEKSSFPCHTDRYLPVVLSPPRDGWNRSKPTPLGQRIGVNQKRLKRFMMIGVKRKP